MVRAQANEEFAQELRNARLVAKGGQQRFVPETFESEVVVGQVMERVHYFISVSEFQETFVVNPLDVPEIAPFVSEFKDEYGRPVQGVLATHPQHPFRTLKTMSCCTSTLAKKLLESRRQIRPHQGEALQTWFLEANQKVASRQLNAPLGAVPDVERLRAWAQAVVEQRAAPRNVEPAPAPAAPLENAAAVPAQEEEDEIEESDGFDWNSVVPGPESSRKRKGKGKNKGRGKTAKGKGGAGGRPSAILPRTPAVPARPPSSRDSGRDDDRSRSPGERSVRTSGAHATAGSMNGDRLSTKATSIREQLTVSMVLSGAKLGQELFQADRVRQALQRSEAHASECVSLKAHLDILRSASKISAPVLGGVKKDVRDQILHQVCPHAREDFPDAWKVALLTVVVRDMRLASEHDISTWIETISPCHRHPIQPDRAETKRRVIQPLLLRLLVTSLPK